MMNICLSNAFSVCLYIISESSVWLASGFVVWQHDIVMSNMDSKNSFINRFIVVLIKLVLA